MSLKLSFHSFFLMIFLFSNVVFGEKIIINYSVTQKKFSPELTEANVGDTILFKPLETLTTNDTALITAYPLPKGAALLEERVDSKKPEFTYVCKVYGNYPLANFHISAMKATLRVLRPAKQAWINVWGAYQQFHQVGNEYFVGDTIIWKPYTTREIKGEEGSHTITSIDIPSGAAPFNGVYNSKDTIFKYVITVPGKYVYHCTPHSHHMVDSFTVSLPTSAVMGVLAEPIHIVPNPFHDKIDISDLNAGNAYTIEVYSLLGEKLYSENISRTIRATLILSKLDAGIYLLKIGSGGKEKVQRMIKY